MKNIQDKGKAYLQGAQDPETGVTINVLKPKRGRPKIAKNPLTTVERITPQPNTDEEFQIYNLLRMGYGEDEIRKMYKSMPTPKFNALLKQARDIQKKAVLDYDSAKADVVDKLWHNYRLAQEIGDIKDSTIILQAIAKILGLTRDVNFEGSQFVTVWAK